MSRKIRIELDLSDQEFEDLWHECSRGYLREDPTRRWTSVEQAKCIREHFQDEAKVLIQKQAWRHDK